MNATEVRELTEQQLDDRLRELHEEWRDLRFQEAVGKLTATDRIRQIRKTIARIHTITTERQIANTGPRPRKRTKRLRGMARAAGRG